MRVTHLREQRPEEIGFPRSKEGAVVDFREIGDEVSGALLGCPGSNRAYR